MSAQRIYGRINDLDIRRSPALAAEKASRIEARISFDGDKTAVVDFGNPIGRALLDQIVHARQHRLPALAILSADGDVIDFHLSTPVLVTSIRVDGTGDLALELSPSACLYRLRHDSENFATFKTLLEKALRSSRTVLISATFENDIVDVRAAPRDQSLKYTAMRAAFSDGAGRLISLEQANMAFSRVAKDNCGQPPDLASLCIPFQFPKDGCYARAHQMCRLMPDVLPFKVWNYGSLRVSTQNAPSCVAAWVYHVAPAVYVATPAGQRIFVIDPSIGAGPAPVEQWRAAQSDTSSTLAYTSGAIYYRDIAGREMVDPQFKNTENRLHFFQGQLLDQVRRFGRSPFPQCHASHGLSERALS